MFLARELVNPSASGYAFTVNGNNGGKNPCNLSITNKSNLISFLLVLLFSLSF